MKKILKKVYLELLKIFTPKVKINDYSIKHYGTLYGGYDIVDNIEIKNFVSCGLGEDASFDVEVLDKKECNVYIVDPTPRALKHFDKIKNNFGSNKKVAYSNNGNQPIESYNLRKVNNQNFILIKKAIFDSSVSKIKLYKPNDDNFVSASINYKENNSENFFFAEVITLDKIVEKYELNKIDLLKLDIEGSEVQVIKDFLKKKIFPTQILIEYTNIRSFNILKHIEIFFIDLQLKKNNYNLVFQNKKGDFTYLYEEKI